MYASSASTPDAFWAGHGKRIDWIKPFTTVKNTSFAPGEVSMLQGQSKSGGRQPGLLCEPQLLPTHALNVRVGRVKDLETLDHVGHEVLPMRLADGNGFHANVKDDG